MSYLLKLSSLFSLVVMLGVSLTSCSDDDLTSTQEFNDIAGEASARGGNARGGDHGGSRCFELVYPLTVVFEDGTTATGEDRTALRGAVEAWREANPDATERPKFQFPIDVIQDGETVSVADADAFEALREVCPDRGGRGGRGSRGHRGGRGHGGLAKCLDVVYPVMIEFGDGSTIQVDSKEAIREAVKAYKEANPDSSARPSFVYPIEVLVDDVVTSVADMDALKELAAGCRGDRGRRGDSCFDLVYPVTFKFEDGTQVTGDSKEEVRKAIRAYITENGRGTGRPDLVFPVTVEYEDGTQATAADQDELKALKEACDNED